MKINDMGYSFFNPHAGRNMTTGEKGIGGALSQGQDVVNSYQNSKEINPGILGMTPETHETIGKRTAEKSGAPEVMEHSSDVIYNVLGNSQIQIISSGMGNKYDGFA